MAGISFSAQGMGSTILNLCRSLCGTQHPKADKKPTRRKGGKFPDFKISRFQISRFQDFKFQDFKISRFAFDEPLRGAGEAKGMKGGKRGPLFFFNDPKLRALQQHSARCRLP